MQIEKEAKAVEWGVLANQIYLHGLRDTFEVDTDHKPLLPLFARHKVTALLRIERMRVRLQGFDYKLNYVPGKKAKAERIMEKIATPGTQNHSRCRIQGQYTRQRSLFVKKKNCLRRTSGQWWCKRHCQMQYNGMRC